MLESEITIPREFKIRKRKILFFFVVRIMSGKSQEKLQYFYYSYIIQLAIFNTIRLRAF